jgi:NAD(P)-dependent dehydrogenase (short-subunit alcohol dehydrogenase family)
MGRANIAERLLREGADVAISYLSEERDARETEDLVEAGRKAILLPGDIGEAKIAESVAWKAIEG